MKHKETNKTKRNSRRQKTKRNQTNNPLKKTKQTNKQTKNREKISPLSNLGVRTFQPISAYILTISRLIFNAM